jgi:hypothetical protein
MAKEQNDFRASEHVESYLDSASLEECQHNTPPLADYIGDIDDACFAVLTASSRLFVLYFLLRFAAGRV